MSKLPIPAAALAQHVIVLGKTRSGKSSKMRVLVEHLLEQDKPVCIIDPKGDWWGLKSDADGKHAGYPIVIFGGKHADVPLNPKAGAAVAELIATGNRPCLIDLKGWMPGDRTRFYIDFVSNLFKLHQGERHLVIDEVHNFAPKGKVFSPEAGMMLHWSNTLASEGQGQGLIMLAASQRPQKVHNDLLTSCETLIACRVIHKADRDAIKDWIDGCADPAIGKQVLLELAGMKRAEAWCWSPEIEFGPERIEWPLFRTYDSFKPQKANTPKLKGWAEVDLEEVRSKLQNVVAEAEANDPAKLRHEIAALKKQLSAAPGKNRVSTGLKPTAADLKAAEAKGFSRGTAESQRRLEKELKSLERLASPIHDNADRVLSHVANLTGAIKQALHEQPSPVAQPAQIIPRNIPTPAPARAALPRSNGNADSEIGTGGKRRVMIALAQNPNGLTKRKLGILSNIRPAGSTWRGVMAQLRRDQHIEDDGETFRLTESGTVSLGEYMPLPTGEALIDHWRGQLGGGSRLAIFNAIVESYPHAISAQRISEITGIDIGGSTWRGHMAKLRGLELVSGSAELVANEDLFS